MGKQATVSIISSELRAHVILPLLVAGVVILALACPLSASDNLLRSAVLLALIVGVIVATWSTLQLDRVELHPERIVEWRGGRMRTFPLDDVVSVRVREVSGGRGDDGEEAYVDRVLVEMKRGAALDFTGERTQIHVWFMMLNHELVPRASLRMDRGETIAFADGESRGIEVSARGIRPLGEATRPGGEVGGYREAHRDAGAWIPWAERPSIIRGARK